jgi:hypothetical protein
MYILEKLLNEELENQNSTRNLQNLHEFGTSVYING